MFVQFCTNFGALNDCLRAPVWTISMPTHVVVYCNTNWHKQTPAPPFDYHNYFLFHVLKKQHLLFPRAWKKARSE